MTSVSVATLRAGENSSVGAPPNDEIEVIDYQEPHRAAVVSLLNLCLRSRTQVQRTEEYWDWKHQRNPAGPSLVLLARQGERIIAARALMRWPLMTPAGPRIAYRPVDTVTHPDWQRRGIFSLLTRAALDRISLEPGALVFNTPNANSLPGYLKLGWQRQGKLPVMVRAARPWRALRRLIGQRISKGASDCGPASITPDVGSYPSRDLERPLSAAARLLDGMSSCADRWRTAKTEAWLRWRYAEHPTTRYRIAIHGPAESPRAVAVYRHNLRGGMREVVLNEFLGDPRLYRAVARQAACESDADYLVALGCGCAESLRRAGFVRMRYKDIDLAARSAAEPSSGCAIPPAPAWALSFGDVEGL